MNHTRRGQPCVKELLPYVSRQPGSICISGTLPWAASLLQMEEAFQCKQPSRSGETPHHCLHPVIGLTQSEQAKTPIDIDSMIRRVAETKGIASGLWLAWRHSDGVAPHIHLVAGWPNSIAQVTAECSRPSGGLPSNSLISKLFP